MYIYIYIYIYSKEKIILFAIWYFKFHVTPDISLRIHILFICLEKQIKLTLNTSIKCIKMLHVPHIYKLKLI